MAGSSRWVAGSAVVLAFVLAFAGAGCDALLGLGQFKDVGCAYDCPDATRDAGVSIDAGDAGPLADASDGSDSPGLLDAPFVPDSLDELAVPEAASPHQRWAHWPMPNPDASIAPDSSTPLPHTMTYEAGTGGTVVDAVTWLIWQRPASSQAVPDYTSAWTACQSVGMRLPTRIELVSLIDFTRSPTIDVGTFPDTQPAPYWTSSAVWADGGPGAAAEYWKVDFGSGIVAPSSLTSYVRCVAGGAQ
jgi:hypothetical protein